MKMLVYLTKRENFISFQDNSLSGLLDFSSSNGSISNSLYVSNINDGTATLSGGSITNLDLVKTSVASVTSNLSAGTVKVQILKVHLLIILVFQYLLVFLD